MTVETRRKENMTILLSNRQDFTTVTLELFPGQWYRTELSFSQILLYRIRIPLNIKAYTQSYKKTLESISFEYRRGENTIEHIIETSKKVVDTWVKRLPNRMVILLRLNNKTKKPNT